MSAEAAESKRGALSALAVFVERRALVMLALGFASGYATAKLTPRLRKLGLELATVGYRLFDGLTMRMARKREDLEDLIAEARARVRTPPPPPPSQPS